MTGRSWRLQLSCQNGTVFGDFLMVFSIGNAMNYFQNAGNWNVSIVDFRRFGTLGQRNLRQLQRWKNGVGMLSRIFLEMILMIRSEET
jgi:hypothetical protein